MNEEEEDNIDLNTQTFSLESLSPSFSSSSSTELVISGRKCYKMFRRNHSTIITTSTASTVSNILYIFHPILLLLSFLSKLLLILLWPFLKKSITINNNKNNHSSHLQFLLLFSNNHNHHRNFSYNNNSSNNNNRIFSILFNTIILFFLLTRSSLLMVKCDPLSNASGGGGDGSIVVTVPSPSPLTALNFRCPEQFGYYADEFNCSKYYVCVFGEALHESCTGGLRFSSELQTCDWPRNVVCPFEDSDYDDTDDEFHHHGDPSLTNDLTRPKSSSSQQHIGSGMIIETTTATTTTTSPSSTTARPSSLLNNGVGQNSGGYVSEHPFVAIHKQQQQQQSHPTQNTNFSIIRNNNQVNHQPPPPTNSLIYHTARFNTNTNTNNNDSPTSHHQPNVINGHSSILLQDSFDKLIKSTQSSQQQQANQSGRQPKQQQQLPQNQHNQVLVPNNYLDEILVDYNNNHQNGNITNYQIRPNNRHRNLNNGHLHNQNNNNSPNHVDDDGDLDENFTLVDLQRSRHGSSNGLNNPSHHHNHRILNNNPILSENILGTIGRSVNGENNSAQSVSVVASTSSKAIIPEIPDFVFKNNHNQISNDNSKILLSDKVGMAPPTSGIGASSDGKHLEPSPNQLLIDEILQLTQAFNNENTDGKFDDVITAIVDENGAIHLAGGPDSPALLRLLAVSKPSLPPSLPPNTNQLLINNDKQEGLAASNRNTASQQILINNNGKLSAPQTDADKYKYQTTTTSHQRQQPTRLKSQSEPEIDFDSLEPGSILVYNKTQLIVVPETKPGTIPTSFLTNQTLLGSNSIQDHQPGRGQHLEYLTTNDAAVDSSNKPRQLITRTDKESSYLYNQNFHNNSPTNKSSMHHHLGSKERVGGYNPKVAGSIQKPSTNVYSTISTLKLDDIDDNVDDDGISLMVNIPNTSGGGMMKDFQRIGPPPSSTNSNKTQQQDSDTHKRRIIPEYRSIPALRSNTSNTINTTSISSNNNRLGNVRHLGSHHRISQSKPSSSTSGSSSNSSTNSTRLGKNLQIPQRPSSLYKTPEPFSQATKCIEQQCKLPDCFCGGADVPGGLSVKDVPQLVLISFDDAVNDINWHIYEELLNSGRSNPNGCPIKATFYVSHEWTDYSQVQTLYSRGHEIASHSITHSFGESYDKQQWYKEIVGQREILHLYGGVNKVDIRGMRAPFLQGGGNKQFEMLHEENFTYDSSMPVFENSPPFWPYTLDYSINHECMIAPCPTKSFPGLWEIGLVMWQDLHGGRCSMGDACSNPSDENGVYEMIMKNFKRHYNSNRAPFGLYYHSAWFNSEHHRTGFIRVIDDLLTYYKDVYFVTKWELIQWIRNPTPLKELYRVNLFGCARDPHRPPPCLHPNICNVGSNSGARFLKTCQPCPKRYPWLDDNGQ